MAATPSSPPSTPPAPPATPAPLPEAYSLPQAAHAVDTAPINAARSASASPQSWLDGCIKAGVSPLGEEPAKSSSVKPRGEGEATCQVRPGTHTCAFMPTSVAAESTPPFVPRRGQRCVSYWTFRQPTIGVVSLIVPGSGRPVLWGTVRDEGVIHWRWQVLGGSHLPSHFTPDVHLRHGARLSACRQLQIRVGRAVAKGSL